MMNKYWDKLSGKIDAMSKREIVLIFLALTVITLGLVNNLLLENLFSEQKELRSQLVQQKVQLEETRAKIATVMDENSPNSNSPLRIQINRVKQELADANVILKGNRDNLVQPEKMAAHLKRLLARNGRLQLVSLQTLVVTPLIEEADETVPGQAGDANSAAAKVTQEKQVFKHGVQLTVSGNYMDLMNYLAQLERLPQQMYWAKASMSVVQYPTTELTLVLYTLSLDKTWLQI